MGSEMCIRDSFRTTEEIKAEYPQIPAYETYDELLEAIKKVLA